MMREYVGTCTACGVQIYCHDGFIGGIVLEGGNLLCFTCFEANERKQEE